MQLVDAPGLPPGSCYLTGASEGPFIDTLVDIDEAPNQGRVYIAVTTIESMAQLIGCAPPVAWQRARVRLAEQAEQIASLEEQVRTLTASNASLLAAGYAPVEHDDDADLLSEVPAGNIETVLEWVLEAESVEEQVARAQAALGAEELESRPRVTLQRDLEQFVRTAREEVPA